MIAKRILFAFAIATLSLQGTRAPAQNLVTDWLTTGLSFNDCMRHADRVFRETGFSDVKAFKVGFAGSYGPNAAQILCLPNRVVAFAATGEDAANHLANLKQTFVNLR